MAEGFRISLHPNQIRHVVVTANVETNKIWKLGIWKTEQEGISFFRNTNEIKTPSAFYSAVLWALQVCRGGFPGGLSPVWGCRDVLTVLTKESDRI